MQFINITNNLIEWSFESIHIFTNHSNIFCQKSSNSFICFFLNARS